MEEKRQRNIAGFYLILYIVAAVVLVLNQPLYNRTLHSNPPDEVVRYKVPLYICNHGTLPTGFEEELTFVDVDYTYGFYTLLPHIAQGYAMRFVKLFTDSELALLYTARFVNVCFGLMMAYIVVLIGKRLFADRRMQWLFCFLVMLLPQSLFLHTYVNSDSLCLLSTALMLYGLIRGYGDDFSVKSCLILALGVILCALSYYNAYGFIVSSILLFTAHFFQQKDGKCRFAWASFWKKGLFIALLVLLCISWQFVRNFLLYDGDFLGISTKEAFMKAGGTIRDTYYSRGESLFAMLFGTLFFPKLAVSVISNYGSVSIYTWPVVYVFYLLLFAVGIIGRILVRDKGSGPRALFVHANMIFCMLMPLLLLVRYAYTIDYQAQGRYILPGIIPFMYYVCSGIERLPVWRRSTEKRKDIAAAILLAGIAAALLLSIVSAMPYYLQSDVLWE
ncbi:MAG: DUF2142 domain-containing protein [Lachnospiraceae bacterium]|nr:DUF2142 domain-containing protein [Lachnospiraceae bacterium]